MEIKIGDVLVDDPTAIVKAWVYEDNKWLYRQLTKEEEKLVLWVRCIKEGKSGIETHYLDC